MRPKVLWKVESWLPLLVFLEHWGSATMIGTGHCHALEGGMQPGYGTVGLWVGPWPEDSMAVCDQGQQALSGSSQPFILLGPRLVGQL